MTDDELKALEGDASKTIDIEEFVPLAKVDPVYFEKAYYLGPDKGGEKAYRLLTDAMAKSGRVAPRISGAPSGIRARSSPTAPTRPSRMSIRS